MFSSNKISVFAAFLFGFCSSVDALDYSTLEGLGVVCPERDSCKDYLFDKEYYDRSCECDSLCSTYKDCCIDARGGRLRGRTLRGSRACVPIGQDPNEGIYAVDRCSRIWSGPQLIRQRCEAASSLRDPLLAVPVISVSEGTAYKNRYCAECNNVAMDTLTALQLLMSCESLPDLSEAQIMADITYNERSDSWGIYRLNSFGNETKFVSCDIHFDVPDYAKNSVRFCRSNLTSTCPSSWTRNEVRSYCEQYMAVIFGPNNAAYRNPHCAVCNGESVKRLRCVNGLSGRRRRPMSFALLLDINQSDGDQVGISRVPTPSCPVNEKYDPYFKRCRELVCALPGYRVVNGSCVRS